MKQLAIISLLFFASLCSAMASGQDSVHQQKSKKTKFGGKSMSYQSSSRGKDEAAPAREHEYSAGRFLKAGDLIKAEQHLKSALDIYSGLRMKEDISRVSRNLAKVQEQLGRNAEAIGNYQRARDESPDGELQVANDNDVKRLQNPRNPEAQGNYSNANVELFKKQGNKEEVADAYVQQAKSNTMLNNSTGAIQNYNQALNYTDSNTVQQTRIKDEMANLYITTNQSELAKDIKKEVIAEAQQNKDLTTEIRAQQSLAGIYMKEKNEKEAVRLLQESYRKAVESSNTLEARNSLELLIRHYREKGDYERSIQLYGEFMRLLEQLVHSDSTLSNSQLLESTQEKLTQIETEKGLQDELLEQTSLFNYLLAGGIVVTLILLFFAVRAVISVKKKNKEIALQSLRREMNPHFIFNSLNSVNQFIAENKEMEANKYLSSYSNLMRNVMENSNRDFISLSRELELIRKYLDLEHLRFREKFDYKIHVDEGLDPDATFIPNMIIQPQLENAVWHGLRYKNGKGTLEVKFSLANGHVKAEILDDGIGLTKSKELKTQNQKSHDSRGLSNTQERIRLLNELYKTDIQLNITERTGNGHTGTRVEMRFPIINRA